MREKYTFTLAGASLPHRLVLVKEQQERREHVVMKLLSFVLYARDGLTVEPKLDERFQPDVAAVAPDGTLTLWIDCGYLSFDKVDKVLVRHRRAELVLVKENERQMLSFRANCLRRAERAAGARNLSFLAFSDGFVAARAEALGHRQEIEVLSRGTTALRLAWNGEDVETALLVVGAV